MPKPGAWAALRAALGVIGGAAMVLALSFAPERFSPRPPPPTEPVRDVARLATPLVTWVQTTYVTLDEHRRSRHELRLEDKIIVTVSSRHQAADEPAPESSGKPGVQPDPPRASLSLAGWATRIAPNVPVQQTLNRLVPFINGIAIKGAYPVSIEMPTGLAPGPGQAHIVESRFHYRLARADVSKDAWTVLLGRPGSGGAHRPVTLTIGSESGYTLPTDFDTTAPDPADETQLQLMAVSSWWPGIVIAMGLVLIWFIYKAQTTSILRDSDREPEKGKLAPYSLARVQMAVWLFIVVGVYLLIWLITRDRSELPASVLVLIGLSSATTVGSLLIDANKRSQRRELNLKRVELEERLRALQNQRAAAASPEVGQRLDSDLRLLEAELTGVQERLGSAPPAVQNSEGFLTDILDDGNGVSLHRLQIVIWTVVLALVFVVTAWRSLSMPVFSEGLLALMGISSGTYLGVKGTENG